MSKQFEGFKLPNTTPVPDILFDELLSELTGNELKVLLYIIRRTYGFGKNADAISLSQFRRGITTKDEKVLDKGCGIEHNRTILVALRALEAKGYIISKKRQTSARDADTTIYRLHFKDSPEANADGRVVTSDNYPSLPQVTTLVTPSNDGRYPTSLPVVTPGNTQETVIQLDSDTRNSLQEDTLDASASTHAQQNVIDFKKATDGRMKAISSHSQETIRNIEEEEDVSLAETQKHQAVQKPGAGMDLPLAADPPIDGQGDATSSQAHSRLTDATPAQHSGYSPGIPASAGAAQAIPKRPRSRKPPVYLELTLQGAAVKSWYEEARGTKLRMSSGNVAACNSLGDNEDVAETSLKAVIEHLDNLSWVKEHEYAIDIQVLAKDDSRLNFEKNWPLVKRKLALKAKQDERNNGTYSDFDIYVGNGPAEREAALADYEEHRKNGTLAW
jgi:hypothetical protein